MPLFLHHHFYFIVGVALVGEEGLLAIKELIILKEKK